MQIEGILPFSGNNKKRSLRRLGTVQNLPNTFEGQLLKSTDAGCSDSNKKTKKFSGALHTAASSPHTDESHALPVHCHQTE